MAQGGLPFKFKCPLCGGTTLELDQGYDDSSVASCGSCGTSMGRLGDLKRMAAEQSGQQPSGPTTFKGFKR